METGWSEDFEDLMHDARLWLFGTGLVTKVVIVVSFTEVTAVDEAEDTPDQIMGDNDDDEEDESPNEQAVLANVSANTQPQDLADQLLSLHRAARLAKPLLGHIHSTLHVFRRDVTNTQILEDFTATVLPAPQAPATEPNAFDLTMRDVFGDSSIPPVLDPTAHITFSIERLRDVIGRQIPKMERHRAIARAAEVMKKKGFAEKKETFAVLKKMGLLGEVWD